MSSDCSYISSETANNVCDEGWCYSDYNCHSKCCQKVPSYMTWHLCTSDKTNCQNNLPTYYGCGRTGCDTTEKGNLCDGGTCNLDFDCASKCCIQKLGLCTHDYDRCMIQKLGV